MSTVSDTPVPARPDPESRGTRIVVGVCGLIDRLTGIGAAFAAICCALLALMLIVEVAATAGLGWSQPWAVEYAAYLCAFTLFAGSGHAVRQGAHIRVRVLLALASAALARWVDLICTLMALIVSSILSYGLVELAVRSAQRGSASYFTMQTPLAWPQGLLAASAVLLTLALVARALRLLIGHPPEAPGATTGPE